MASSGLRKMLILITFQHWMVSECWCVLQFYGHSGILLLCFMADVTPYVLWHIVCIGRCYCHKCGRCCCHIMFSRCYNHQTDGTACCLARWQMLLPSYCVWQMLCQISLYVAIVHVVVHDIVHVIAKVADVIAYCGGCGSISKRL